jgi:hypothetical protein
VLHFFLPASDTPLTVQAMCFMTAAVKSEVVAEPPMSAVLILPELITLKVAVAILLARLSRLGDNRQSTFTFEQREARTQDV